jgi:hypothetical protein
LWLIQSGRPGIAVTDVNTDKDELLKDRSDYYANIFKTLLRNVIQKKAITILNKMMVSASRK